MARDGAGNYTLPLPPVAPGDLVESTWANTTLADLRDAMTDSLSRSGKGGMTAPFAIDDGTVTAPGLKFTAEGNSGLYRAAAGDVRMAVIGVDQMRWHTTLGVQVWSGSVWTSLIGDAPADGEYYSRIDNTWTVNPAVAQNTQDIADNVVAISQNIVNISTNANNIADNTTNIATNTAAIATKVEEAPEDGTPYSRQDAGWVASPGGVSEAPIDGTAYSRKDGAWDPTPGGADPNDLITAQAWDGQVFLSTRATANFSTTIRTFTELVATDFKSGGPIRHLGLVATTSINPANGNRYTLTASTSQNLDFTLPSGIDADLGEHYVVEGNVAITNSGIATITLQEGGSPVPAENIKGTQPTDSGAKYTLTYIIHHLSSSPDTYETRYIWSA
jgi:hypothetical protein